MNWNRLFIRQGFMVSEVSENVFYCKNETENNLNFLLDSLEKLRINYSFAEGMLSILSASVSEKQWLNVVDFEFRGRGEGLWFKPGVEEPKVNELDTYISGLVRQFNRLGLYTEYCCDGHDRNRPTVYFTKDIDMNKVSMLFHAVGLTKFKIRNQAIRMLIPRKQLLDLTEKVNKIELDWLKDDIEFIKKQLFLNQLEQCLSIDGESGNEEEIRQFVIEQLRPLVDHLTIDRTGNILAQKLCGTGSGPTILVNAHLDTYEAFYSDRKIIKDGTIWSSSIGILGADDRAGVTVLLELAKRLEAIKFSGIVKFIFTVEEEVGLCGARGIDDYFLWDVDAAFVVDRRGTGDIVTSCGGYEPFCDGKFGAFLEEVANANGLVDWKCTSGGSSDTRIWASHGIESVNLSVGYQNEHKSTETLDTDACYETLQLLLAVFQQESELKRLIRRIHNEERLTTVIQN